jgi:hypothetical protein
MSNRTYLTIAVVLSCATWFASGAGDAGTIGQWRFDEPSGAIAADSVGGHPGTLYGGAAFVPGGISGNAVSLTRSLDSFVTMGDAFAMTTGDFSLVFWVKTAPGDQTSDLIAVAKHESGFYNGYFANLNLTSTYGLRDKALFYHSSTPGNEVVSSTTVNDGEWHQIVCVYHAGGTAEIYVDGGIAEQSKPSTPIIDNSADFMVGGIFFGGSPAGLFDGLIDELQIFDHALDAAEVEALYSNPEALLVFADGFESSDTSEWSTVVP